MELILSMVSLISNECHEALQDVYGDDYTVLNKEEQLVLATAITEKAISNYRMQQLLDKNPLEVGKILYSLIYYNNNILFLLTILYQVLI